MKGIIFTEFLDMVEAQFGLAVVDEIITNSKTLHQGIYTSVGTYDFNEMISLLVALSFRGCAAEDLARTPTPIAAPRGSRVS